MRGNFGKVFQSKELKGIKQNKNKFNILLRASEASEENLWLKPIA